MVIRKSIVMICIYLIEQSRAGRRGTSFDFWHGQGGNIYTTKKNTEALVVTGKEIGLQISAEKTKYVSRSVCRTKPQHKSW
jgi:hypothetical protein